jgi:DNA invertase Pin-like site-specific DNA recombinase
MTIQEAIMATAQLYGYVRVSHKEQNEARQLIAMQEFGVPSGNIFADHQSGKDFNRPAYQKLLAKIKPGDAVVIKSIDRLGRNYEEIIEQWRLITKERRAAIVVIDIPILDTRQKSRDLTGTFIADLVLEILSYVAETERDNIRQRQAEGIAAAKTRGVRFGRPRLKRPKMFYKLLDEWRNNEISARAAAKRLGISHTTFLTWSAEEVS